MEAGPSTPEPQPHGTSIKSIIAFRDKGDNLKILAGFVGRVRLSGLGVVRASVLGANPETCRIALGGAKLGEHHTQAPKAGVPPFHRLAFSVSPGPVLLFAAVVLSSCPVVHFSPVSRYRPPERF